MNNQVADRRGKPGVMPLLADLEGFAYSVPADFGGGSTLSKSFLMAYLATQRNLRTYVEIGVYRGRSLFPLARAMHMMGGTAYGIDPYDKEMAREFDLDESDRQKLDRLIDSIDWDALYQQTCSKIEELGLTDSCTLLRHPSKTAVDFFTSNQIIIDMLHIDGNHDTACVLEDFTLYFPLVSDRGLIVMDDINWPSVIPALEKAKEACEVVFLSETFAILAKARGMEGFTSLEKRRCGILHSMVRNFEEKSYPESALRGTASRGLPRVSVVLLSYNQEEYIADCIEGILAQRGAFTIELVIGDDSSTDGTMAVLQEYVRRIQGHDRFEVVILPTDRHRGMIPNFRRCLDACTGDYVAVCEGDDYWIDEWKLHKQVSFLMGHPECSLCFHDILVQWMESGLVERPDEQKRADADTFTTRDIILDYTIGNLSSCMFDARHLASVPAQLYDLPLGDWMFNIYYSTFGLIGRVRDVMSVYRKHKGGYWVGMESSRKVRALHAAIAEYNRFTNYEFDAEFSRCQRQLEETGLLDLATDITIVDDFFPHRMSAFRWQEFMCYLEELANVQVLTSCEWAEIWAGESADAIIASFKRDYPVHAEKIKRRYPRFVGRTKVLYCVFLNLALQIKRMAEELEVPFVFTLYPGGGFALGNAESDKKLREVTSSPCFRKVIVTQRLTYDYLIRKRFCTPGQIAFIYGGVVPLKYTIHEYPSKKHYGIDKDTLDICFVAQKYTERGVDKGYDIFIEVAHQLCGRYDDIRFHVVGGFDEKDIDVSAIHSRITFYGRRDIEWFDEFYEDKDIILSPNSPELTVPGAFDGFPTASCVDAGLRETAVFCTDVLHMNEGRFIEGQEIVIIPRDASAISRLVERYRDCPESLRAVAVQGRRKFMRLFGREAQIIPRIAVLREEIEQCEVHRVRIRRRLRPACLERRLMALLVAFGRLLRKAVPASVKALVWRVLHALGVIRGDETLVMLLKRVTPEFVKSAYRRMRG